MSGCGVSVYPPEGSVRLVTRLDLAGPVEGVGRFLTTKIDGDFPEGPTIRGAVGTFAFLHDVLADAARDLVHEDAAGRIAPGDAPGAQGWLRHTKVVLYQSAKREGTEGRSSRRGLIQTSTMARPSRPLEKWASPAVRRTLPSGSWTVSSCSQLPTSQP